MFFLVRENSAITVNIGSTLTFELPCPNLYISQMNSEIKVGDCFLFKPNSKIYGFVAWDCWKYKSELNIKLIPITFTAEAFQLEEIRNHGFVFSTLVFNGVTNKDEPGLFMYDISSKNTTILGKFDYAGTFELDQEKISYSGGTSLIKVDDFVSHIGWLENGSDDHVKLPLKNFLKSEV